MTIWASPEELSNVQWLLSAAFSIDRYLMNIFWLQSQTKAEQKRRLLLSVIPKLKNSKVFLPTDIFFCHPIVFESSTFFPVRWGKKDIWCMLPISILLPSLPSQFWQFSSSFRLPRKGIHHWGPFRRLKRSYWRKNSSWREFFRWFPAKTTHGEEEKKKYTVSGSSWRISFKLLKRLLLFKDQEVNEHVNSIIEVA